MEKKEATEILQTSDISPQAYLNITYEGQPYSPNLSLCLYYNSVEKKEAMKILQTTTSIKKQYVLKKILKKTLMTTKLDPPFLSYNSVEKKESDGTITALD